MPAVAIGRRRYWHCCSVLMRPLTTLITGHRYDELPTPLRLSSFAAGRTPSSADFVFQRYALEAAMILKYRRLPANASNAIGTISDAKF